MQIMNSKQVLFLLFTLLQFYSYGLDFNVIDDSCKNLKEDTSKLTLFIELFNSKLIESSSDVGLADSFTLEDREVLEFYSNLARNKNFKLDKVLYLKYCFYSSVDNNKDSVLSVLKQIAKIEKDIWLKGLTYQIIAQRYSDLNEFDSITKFIEKASLSFGLINDKGSVLQTKSILADYYIYIGMEDLALSIYRNIFKEFLTLKDFELKKPESFFIAAFGLLEYSLNKDSSEKYLKSILPFFYRHKEQGNSSWEKLELTLLTYQGANYIDRKKYDSAKFTLKEVETIVESLTNNSIDTYAFLDCIYSFKVKYYQSSAFFNSDSVKCYLLAQINEENDLYYQKKALNNFLNFSLKDDELFLFLEEYDSLARVQNSLQNKYLMSKMAGSFEHKRHEKELITEKLKREVISQKLRSKTYLIIFSFLALGLLIFVVFQSFKLRKIKYQRLHYQTKNSLLKSSLTPHFLANTLSLVQSKIYKTDPESSEILSDLGLQMRFLYQDSNRDYISLSDELKSLKNYLDFIKKIDELIDYSFDLSGIENSTCLIHSLMLQPLVENAVKYSEIREGKKSVRIEINKTTNQSIQFLIENVSSRPIEKLSSMGVIKDRLRCLEKKEGRKLDFSYFNNNSKTTVVIEVPIYEGVIS